MDVDLIDIDDESQKRANAKENLKMENPTLVQLG